MTEDEAKTKWCPHARVMSSGISAGNRHILSADGLNGADRCIASACMAWRTQHQWRDNAQDEPSWVSYPPYAFVPGPSQERDDGFCGLVGQAQP